MRQAVLMLVPTTRLGSPWPQKEPLGAQLNSLSKAGATR